MASGPSLTIAVVELSYTLATTGAVLASRRQPTRIFARLGMQIRIMPTRNPPGSFAGVDRGLVRYFMRLHTDSALVPVEVAGFVL